MKKDRFVAVTNFISDSGPNSPRCCVPSTPISEAPASRNGTILQHKKAVAGGCSAQCLHIILWQHSGNTVGQGWGNHCCAKLPILPLSANAGWGYFNRWAAALQLRSGRGFPFLLYYLCICSNLSQATQASPGFDPLNTDLGENIDHSLQKFIEFKWFHLLNTEGLQDTPLCPDRATAQWVEVQAHPPCPHTQTPWLINLWPFQWVCEQRT